MEKRSLSAQISALFRKSEWAKARGLLEKEQKRNSGDHWLLTQIGVTFYEEGKYGEACRLFLKSLKIVADCPLTLWNLAGTLDATGQPLQALKIYTWLLRTNKSAKDDPCWESKKWSDALKTDSVYRIGVCFQHIGDRNKAEDCYRQYLNLLLIGGEGSYSIEDVTQRIRKLHEHHTGVSIAGAVKRAATSALKDIGAHAKGNSPPVFDERDLLPMPPAACR
jgi:tetratricopeptide (TPR) repeat protein